MSPSTPLIGYGFSLRRPLPSLLFRFWVSSIILARAWLETLASLSSQTLARTLGGTLARVLFGRGNVLRRQCIQPSLSRCFAPMILMSLGSGGAIGDRARAFG